MKSALLTNLLVMVATASVGVSTARAEGQARSSAGPGGAAAAVWIDDTKVRVPVDRVPDPDRLAAVVVGLRRPGSLHVSVPARSGPRSRASQGAGNRAALLDYALGNFALGAWASGEREASLALLKFADTVPMGKAVAVRAYYRGTRFIGLTTNPDGAWMAPTDHYRTVTVRGTNVMKAVEENYHCVFDAGGGALCIPPEDLEEAPDGEKNYLRSAVEAGGSPAAWTRVVEELRNDVHGRTEALLLQRGPAQETENTETHAARMERYRKTVYVAGAVLGFGDREAGRAVGLVGTAVLDVFAAAQKFHDMRNAPGIDGVVSAIGLGHSMVGLSLAFATAFMDAGPSAEAIILEEIVRLQRQVQTLRREMHERFDDVHRHLESISSILVDGIDVLVDRDRRSLESILARLAERRRQLTEIAGVQLDGTMILVEQLEWLAELITDFELAGCRRAHSAADGDPMELSKFRDCRAKLATLHKSLSGRPLSEPETRSSLRAGLKERSERTVSWSFWHFKRLLAATGLEGATRAAALPDSVVGPEAWYAVMNLHDGFLVDYPAFAEKDAAAIAGSEFSTSMRQRRSDLVRYAKTVREELLAFQEDSRPTVFSKLFEEAWSRDRMAALLRSIGDPVDLLWKCLDVDVTKRADCEELKSVRSSSHVRERLLSMDDFGRMDNALAIAGAHLQAWIALAFRDGIGRSDAVTAVAAGWVAVPDLVELVETSDVGFSSWAALLDEMDARMALLQEMLRSDGMRAEASSEFEDQILTRPAFAGLGDVEFQ